MIGHTYLERGEPVVVLARWAGNGCTRRGAEKSANTHAEEYPGIKVRWVTRPIGA